MAPDSWVVSLPNLRPNKTPRSPGVVSATGTPNIPVVSNQSVEPTTPSMTQLASSKISDLRLPVNAPVDPSLTRSQLLFSIATGVDPRSLSIKESIEFFLFMELREELQWTSFGMTSHKWVPAVKTYNERLAQQGKEAKVAVTMKSPRALMEKLSQVEARILDRVATNNFTCR